MVAILLAGHGGSRGLQLGRRRALGIDLERLDPALEGGDSRFALGRQDERPAPAAVEQNADFATHELGLDRLALALAEIEVAARGQGGVEGLTERRRDPP